MSKLKNKVAVITGDCTDIGMATAKQFIDRGIRVVITDHDQKALDTAVASLGDRAIGIRGDFTNFDNLGHLFSQVQNQVGRVDVLFASSGITPFVPFEVRVSPGK